jgi:hypothetical protein
MTRSILPMLSLLFVTSVAAPVTATDEIPRRPDGRPDLSGTYDIATLTPLERPREFGDNLYLTPEQARAIEEEQREYVARRAERTDPTRNAPEVGGAPPVGLDDSQRGVAGAGEVGGYNNFWVDRGDSVVMVDGKFRTSIITEPANGRRPPMSEQGRARMAARFGGGGGSRPGQYDNPENRPLSDRCIASFSSSVPALPSLYNNVKRIVQTDDHVMLLNEMVHDARVIRLNSEHPPADVRFLHGDSIGWWEGDTLVVDTANFLVMQGVFATETQHIVERFSRKDANTVHYEFMVEDPSRWDVPYKGDFTWPAIDGKLFEYACHEGNYAMGNILRGARLLEKEGSPNN